MQILMRWVYKKFNKGWSDFTYGFWLAVVSITNGLNAWVFPVPIVQHPAHRPAHFTSICLSVYKKSDPCVKSSNKTVANTVLPKIRINMMSSCDIFFLPRFKCFRLFVLDHPLEHRPYQYLKTLLNQWHTPLLPCKDAFGCGDFQLLVAEFTR